MQSNIHPTMLLLSHRTCKISLLNGIHQRIPRSEPQTAVRAIKERRTHGKKERMKEGNEGVRLVAVSGQHPSDF